MAGPHPDAACRSGQRKRWHDNGGRYALVDGDGSLSSAELIERWAALADRYPHLVARGRVGRRRLGRLDGAHRPVSVTNLQLVGDDIFVTNPEIITQGIATHAASAALIKVNQVGTVTETLHAMEICRVAGWGQMVSHRSGETPDPFIVDLAVASGCGQLKSSAPARGERVAKYHRLVVIEAADPMPYGRA